MELRAIVQPVTQKANSDICARKLQKSSCKIFHRKSHDFVNLFVIFCPRLELHIKNELRHEVAFLHLAG